MPKPLSIPVTLAGLLASELADLSQREAIALLASRGVRLLGRGLR